jgi:hypothetical protein
MKAHYVMQWSHKSAKTRGVMQEPFGLQPVLPSEELPDCHVLQPILLTIVHTLPPGGPVARATPLQLLHLQHNLQMFPAIQYKSD